MQLTITVFHQGAPEQFLSHVHMTLKTSSQQGLCCLPDSLPGRLRGRKKLTVATATKEDYQGMDKNLLVIKSLIKAAAAKTCKSEATDSKDFIQYPPYSKK